MSEPDVVGDAGLRLRAAPIVEAVVDIDCDVPPPPDIDAFDAQARAALAPAYPSARRRLMSAHEILATPGEAFEVKLQHGLQALQYASADDKQIVQFRPAGYSFNRLAPYTTLDDYLPEIERTWKLFVEIARPVVCRTVRLRYINRIAVPSDEGRIDTDAFLRFGPRIADEDESLLLGFVHQHTVQVPATGNQANIVLALQRDDLGQVTFILDIEAFKTGDCDPGDWPTVAGRIASLRILKNRIFHQSLTDKCLSLFQS